MTTPDWADEEMRRLLNIFVGDSLMRPDDTAAALTASLRAAFLRGRIAGLREAAEIADRFDWSAGELIRIVTDKLEAGN